MTQKPLTIATYWQSILIGLLCYVTFNSATAATLYKWIDDNGEVRYSDRLPPSAAKKKRQTLNDQGIVVDTIEAAKTDDELAAEAEAKAALEIKQAEEKRLKNAQDKKDRVLLLTFSSEQEMSSVHSNRTEVIDSVIQLIEKSISATEGSLIELEDSADLNYISKGKEVPGGLAQKIEHFSRKIFNRKEQLRLKQEEKRKINEQFELDLARYRLLKQKKSN